MVIWHLPRVLQHFRTILGCRWYSSDRYLSDGYTLYGLTPDLCVFDTVAAIQESDNDMRTTSHVYITWAKLNMQHRIATYCHSRYPLRHWRGIGIQPRRNFCRRMVFEEEGPCLWDYVGRYRFGRCGCSFTLTMAPKPAQLPDCTTRMDDHTLRSHTPSDIISETANTRSSDFKCKNHFHVLVR